ncbi:MAG TPA: FkbM family methyltransferase [Candidatus Paceibacterota bacterium]|nr:FkbM family methyltransferase [Candidatus Paceibacterota bacterium]
MARTYHVTDIRVEGSYGTIIGSPEDGAVLAAYARTGAWAEEFNSYFGDFFEKSGGGTYIDIGANIGLTTIPIGRNAAVVCKAFEPEPRNLAYLQENVRENCPAGNVEIFNTALFDAKTTIEFELAERNLGDHRIRFSGEDGAYGEKGRTQIVVEADLLDNVLDLKTLPQPIAVKIDTQGAEAHVFAGGRTVLASARLVAFEFWPYGLARAQGDTASVRRFLEKNFTEGAAAAESQNEPLVWQPVRAITQLMEELEKDAANPKVYKNIFVRK